MRRNGLRVPEAFIVTASAFSSFLEGLGLAEVATSGRHSADDSRVARDGISAAPIPAEIAKQVLRRYGQLGGPVAVRSSMLGEDSDETSYAGQLDTVLNVSSDDALLGAIRKCWASAFNSRVQAYRQQHEDLGPGSVSSVSTAVVVQKMVDAVAAGVAFSADPVTGERCVVIEAVEGLGDRLVSGLATPDRFVVDGRGTLVETVPADGGSPVLTGEQATELAQSVRSLAAEAGSPQDVEWAWDGNAFWFLQCRPITTLAGKHVFSANIMAEMLPGLVKPLVYTTTSISKATNVFARIFTDMIGPNDIDFSQLVRLIRSRLYVDNTMMGQVLSRIGMPANFFEMMGRGEQAARGRPKMSPGMIRAAARVLRFAIRHGFIADDIEEFIVRHDDDLTSFRAADWSASSPVELLDAYERLMALHRETEWWQFLGPINMQIRNAHMASLIRRHAPDVAASDLIRGLAGLKALEPNALLDDLAGQARGMGPDVLSMMAGGDDETIRRTLSVSARGRTLIGNVDRFLDQYGYLSTAGTDFSRTPWSETPGLIWSAIGRTAQQPPRPPSQDVGNIREQAREKVRSSLSPLLRLHFDRLLKSTLWYVDLRERSSLLYSEDSYQMRRIFLALGSRYVERGELNRPDDVFYLEIDELRSLVNGGLSMESARATIAARRQQMEQDALIELPETIVGDVVPTKAVETDTDQPFLAGISGSRGRVQGTARVILDPADAPPTLTRDDILVVPFTDVGWTPLFAGIGGIVAETGGQLSHTSIVAREYGLPAVVNVKNATHLIHHGQDVTVDGDSGRVYLRDPRDVTDSEAPAQEPS
jgi:pyruvate,water dikinase